jgi:peptidoglycan/LPS O-acetylase OafA/YrhL
MVLVWHYFQLGPKLAPAPGTFLAHMLIPLRLAWTGVDLFFVLSGFLIGGILLTARGSENYFKVFYIRRFFRILPIYLVALLVFPALLHLVQIKHPGDYSWLATNLPPWWSFVTFTQNFWMASHDTLGANLLAITWSLAIEEQFYLTLPLLIKVLSERLLVAVVVTGICVAPLLRSAMRAANPYRWVAAFVLMPCRMDALLLGVLAAILLREPRNWDFFRRNGRNLRFVLGVLAAGVLILSFTARPLEQLPSSPLMQQVGYTWVALFYATLLVFVLTSPDSALSALLRNRMLRWLGMLAYGTYLIHQAVQGFVFAAIHCQPGSINSVTDLLVSVACLAITLLLSSLSWRYFESPLIKIGHRMTGSTPKTRSVPRTAKAYFFPSSAKHNPCHPEPAAGEGPQP